MTRKITTSNEVSPGDLERDETDCDGNCSECDDVNDCALTELIEDIPLPGDRGVQEDPETPLPDAPDAFAQLDQRLEDLGKVVAEAMLSIGHAFEDALKAIVSLEAACDGQCTECNGAGECGLDDQRHEVLLGPDDEGFEGNCPSDEGCRHCKFGEECNGG